MNNVLPIGHNNPPSDIEIVRSRLEEREANIRAAFPTEEVPPFILDDKAAASATDVIKSLSTIKKGIEGAHKEIKAPYLECGKAVDGWKNALEADIDKIRKEWEKPLSDFLTKKAAAERKRQEELAAAQRAEAERLANEAAAHSAANLEGTANELIDEAVKSEALANRIESNLDNAKSSELAKSRSATGAVSSQKTAWVGKIVSLSGVNLETLRPYLSEDVIQKALNSFVRNGGRVCDGATISEEIVGLNIR